MWIQVINGPVVNSDNTKSLSVENTVLILEMVSQRQVSVAYGSSSDAYASKAAVESALLNPTAAPTPTIATIFPNSIVGANGADLLISGVDFRSSAAIQFVANPAGPPNSAVIPNVFVSTNVLALRLAAGTLTAGTFDVVYTDGSGSTDTLATGLTVT